MAHSWMRGLRHLFLAGAFWLLPTEAPAVTFDWATILYPTLPPLPVFDCGGATEVYRISKTEVTNGQYAEFLNAVAKADRYGLYNENMAADVFVPPDQIESVGIIRTGVEGEYEYTVTPGYERYPITYVSFWDALRFVNWLHNGQPVDPPDSALDDGAYTLLPGMAASSVSRNAAARFFLPTQHEWCKAGYFENVRLNFGNYQFRYPTGTDDEPTCAPPSPVPNTANCSGSGVAATEVGAYTGSPSSWDTFDQGGNVREWTEDTFNDQPITKGGSFRSSTQWLAWTLRHPLPASNEDNYTGFRVAAISDSPQHRLLIDLEFEFNFAWWGRERGVFECRLDIDGTVALESACFQRPGDADCIELTEIASGDSDARKFVWECEPSPNFADVDAQLPEGSYLYRFNQGLASQDSATFPFVAPFTVYRGSREVLHAPPPGFLEGLRAIEVVAPPHGSRTSDTPTIEWEICREIDQGCPSGGHHIVDLDLYDPIADEVTMLGSRFPPSSGSTSVSVPLKTGRTYETDVQYAALQTCVDAPTSRGLLFQFCHESQTFHATTFTVPEPGSPALRLLALCSIALLGRKKVSATQA